MPQLMASTADLPWRCQADLTSGDPSEALHGHPCSLHGVVALDDL